MAGDPNQDAIRRARLLHAAREARWTGFLFLSAGITFVLLGPSTNSAGRGIIGAGALILVLGQAILLITRHRHPHDDPAVLAKTASTPTAPQRPTPRRRWHDVAIPPGSRYITNGHPNDLAERRVLRRAGALIVTVTILGCGIAGLFLFDSKTYPVILLTVGSVGSVVAGGLLVRFLLEIAAEGDRDWPHL